MLGALSQNVLASKPEEVLVVQAASEVNTVVKNDLAARNVVTPVDENGMNPWRLLHEPKKGQALMVAQAWDRRVADRKKVSMGTREVYEVLEADYFREIGEKHERGLHGERGPQCA